MADDPARARYARLTDADVDGAHPRWRGQGSASIALDDVVHLVRHPLDGKLMAFVEAGPVHARNRRVWAPAFFIDVEPVSNAEYVRFLVATDHRPPSTWPKGHYDITDDPNGLRDEPVTGLTYVDVAAYARWAGKSLPTMVQLDQAARGGVIVLRGREWCDHAGQATQHGPAPSAVGGFRCASRTTVLLNLLAI
jgi:hypothetical protein